MFNKQQDVSNKTVKSAESAAADSPNTAKWKPHTTASNDTALHPQTDSTADLPVSKAEAVRQAILRTG